MSNDLASAGRRKVGWDFEDESPGNDARGFAREGSMPPEVETHLVNAVLTNGARYYVDHAHPEYSTPECADALSALLFDKAGEQILARSMDAAARMLPPGQAIVVYKNNSDGKGNSYGCHENYLMDRAVPFGRIVAHVMPHFVTRQIFTGVGQGRQRGGGGGERVHYQLTQRADFFEEEVGLETTLKRPIVNTRDEPHCDAQKYRRLHVIVGDANLAEVATFLKVGTTALVLSMIEDDFFGDREFALAGPVRAMREVSYDLTLGTPLELADRRTHDCAGDPVGALRPRPQVRRGARLRVGRRRGDRPADPAALGDGARPASRPTRCRCRSSSTGWPSTSCSTPTATATGSTGTTPGWRRSTCSTTTCARRSRCSPACPWSGCCVDEDVDRAMTEPPTDTRAYFRGQCLKRWGSMIAAANWDSLVFDLGDEPLRRVPMMEPLRGTAELVDSLLDGCDTPAQLFERLGN